MKVTYRTFIRFHTRCTKNKPDSVSQEIAARERLKRRNIWNLYSCCRNIQGGSRVIYLCIVCPGRKSAQEGLTAPQGHTCCFMPHSVLQGSAQCQSSAGIGETGILFQPKLSNEEKSETEKCTFMVNPPDISGLCFPPHQDKRNVWFSFLRNGRGRDKEIQFGKVKTQQMSKALFDIFS